VSSQSNVNGTSSVLDSPLGVMVLLISDGTDTLDESIGLLKASEFELFGHARQIGGSLPSFGSSSGFNIFDDVVVHLGQLVLAIVIELLILFFKFSDLTSSFSHVLEVRREFGSCFERHQQGELSHRHLVGDLGEAHERLCQHILLLIN
jgi:hypothetical protein